MYSKQRSEMTIVVTAADHCSQCAAQTRVYVT